MPDSIVLLDINKSNIDINLFLDYTLPKNATIEIWPVIKNFQLENTFLMNYSGDIAIFLILFLIGLVIRAMEGHSKQVELLRKLRKIF